MAHGVREFLKGHPHVAGIEEAGAVRYLGDYAGVEHEAASLGTQFGE